MNDGVTHMVILEKEALREVIREVLENTFADVSSGKETESSLLSKQGLAQIWTCSTSTLDRLVRRGLPHFKVGDVRRFSEPECRAWLKQQGAKQ